MVTKQQKRLVERVREAGGLLYDISEHSYGLPDGTGVHGRVARNCIKKGLLASNDDSLFGDEPQSYRAAE